MCHTLAVSHSHHSSQDVPTLIVNPGPDQAVVTENIAILTYIAALAGPDAEARVMGRDALQRAKTVEWLAFASGTIHGVGYGGLWRPGRFDDDEAAHEGIKAKARSNIERAYGIVEGKLAGRLTATGKGQGEIGAADFSLYVFWRWGQIIGVDMKGKFPRYSELAKRVEQVEGVKQTLKAEEQEPAFA